MGSYMAGWSTYETPMTVGVAITAGPTGTITIPEGYYSHVKIGDGGIAGQSYYDVFVAYVETQLDALSAGFTVSFNSTTRRYTISRVSGTFTLNFAGDSGVNLGRALGFQNGSYMTPALSHASDCCPYYIMETAISARSEFSNVYEPEDLVDEAVSDGGTPYGVGRESDEYWCDWVQQMELKANTLALAALPAAPWTWQHLFRHARATHPFLVFDALADIEGARVYTLRAEGAQFTSDVRMPVESDVDRLWNIKFSTRDHGFAP